MSLPDHLKSIEEKVMITPDAFLKAWVEAKITPTEGSMTQEQLKWTVEFMKSHKDIKSVLEIGTNAGLSTGMWLSARPDVKVLSVDLGAHDYVLAAQKLLQKVFPGRYLQIMGDSMIVLPQLKEYPKPDLIFIDGGHEGPIPAHDLMNSLELSKPGTWIIIDDCWPEGKHHPDVFAAVDRAVKMGVLVTLGVFTTKDRSWAVTKRIF
jgi:spermidine synthase